MKLRYFQNETSTEYPLQGLNKHTWYAGWQRVSDLYLQVIFLRNEATLHLVHPGNSSHAAVTYKANKFVTIINHYISLKCEMVHVPCLQLVYNFINLYFLYAIGVYISFCYWFQTLILQALLKHDLICFNIASP